MKIQRFAIVLFLVFVVAGCGADKERKKKDQETAKIHFQLAEVQFTEGKFNGSLKESLYAVELDPENPIYHHLVALNYFFGKRMYDRAEVHFKEALKLKSDFSEAHMNFGAMRLEQKDWKGAIPHFNAVLEDIFYNFPERAHNNLGWAYYNSGELEKALVEYGKAVAINSRLAMTYNNIGIVYYRMEKMALSEEALRKAVAIDPNFAEAHFQLGLTLSKKKEKDGALEAFKKVIDIAPRSDFAKSAKEYIDLIK